MSDSSTFDQMLRAWLEQRRGHSQLRGRRIVRRLSATQVDIDGRTYTNFCSNDYLGLSWHPRVIDAAREALSLHGMGSGAAALISGYQSEHRAAEEAIARWKGSEGAVLLPSGYQANLAAVQAIAAAAEGRGSKVRFLLDKLVHASLIDAVKSTGQAFRVFPHNGLEKLDRLLRDGPKDELQVVLTESIFSMDGDAADLRGLAELRSRHQFILVLDEAHASGVYGPAGRGYAAELGLQDQVDVSIVTCSKALGCIGGAVCGSRVFCDAIVNGGRAYIYSTSVPPAVAAAIRASVEVLKQEPERPACLRRLSRYFRGRLGSAALMQSRNVLDDSPIVPILYVSEQAALDAAAHLAERGLMVVAVRPPTVPRGTSRLRITLCSEHTEAQIDGLVNGLKNWGKNVETSVGGPK